MANFLIDNSPYSIDGLFHAQNCELKRENARLRLEIRTLRERMSKIKISSADDHDICCPACGQCYFYGDTGLKVKHLATCWWKLELDQLKGVE